MPKPKRTSGSSVMPQLAWTVTLSASSPTLWPTQYTTLTATANQDVGPTPYWIDIYENDNAAPLISCGTGTSCSLPITKPTPTFSYFEAVIATGLGAFPPAGSVAYSGYTSVTWKGVSVSLSSPVTTLLGGSVSLIATTSEDVGPSPFYVEIFDTTTGTLLTTCGSGTYCLGKSTQPTALTTHRYVAEVASLGSSFPAANIQEASNPVWVTWSPSNWQVSLTANPDGTVTATTNQDVGPTPYYIEIFGELDNTNGTVASGTRLSACSTGTTCTISPPAGPYLVAFVSGIDATLPPANTQASSPVIPSPTRI